MGIFSVYGAFELLLQVHLSSSGGLLLAYHTRPSYTRQRERDNRQPHCLDLSSVEPAGSKGRDKRSCVTALYRDQSQRMTLTLPSTFISNAPIPSTLSVPPFSSSGISVLYQQNHRSLSTSLSVTFSQNISAKFNTPSTMTAPILLLLPIILICIFNIGMLILIRALFPTILTYPWKIPDKKEEKRDKETTVVFAGSFNPPHWGHLVMIRYLAERYMHSCTQSDVFCCL
jgi:hypothetical protein